MPYIVANEDKRLWKLVQKTEPFCRTRMAKQQPSSAQPEPAKQAAQLLGTKNGNGQLAASQPNHSWAIGALLGGCHLVRHRTPLGVLTAADAWPMLQGLRVVLLIVAMLAVTDCAGPNYAPYDNMTNSYG